MKRVFKIFWAWNYEKEEKWLNDMSRQGWQLQKYTPFELFSDIASRVAHLDRILTLMGTFLFLIGYSFVSFFLTGLDEGFSLGRVLILFGLYLPALILGGSGILGLLRKRRDMEKEKMYRD